jgi:hypothetical protein
MCTMNIEDHSTLDLAFLADKFKGAKKRHKKTVAASKSNNSCMDKTGKTGRKRAAVERQIVHEMNTDIRNWYLEMMLVEQDQKMLEAELSELFDEEQDNSWWFDDECPECRCFHCNCKEMDAMDNSGIYHFGTSYTGEDCLYCGCQDCICDHDFTLKLNPMKARRASRFSEIAGGKAKRLDRYGRTQSHRWLNYREKDKDIERMKGKTASKRAHKRMLDELMDEMALLEADLRGATKRDNVDYSLPARRMVNVDYSLPVLREVHVTRISLVNGERRVISDGVEKMHCRR